MVPLHYAMESAWSRIVVSLAVVSQYCGARFRRFCDKLHGLVGTHSSQLDGRPQRFRVQHVWSVKTLFIVVDEVTSPCDVVDEVTSPCDSGCFRDS